MIPVPPLPETAPASTPLMMLPALVPPRLFPVPVVLLLFLFLLVVWMMLPLYLAIALTSSLHTFPRSAVAAGFASSTYGMPNHSHSPLAALSAISFMWVWNQVMSSRLSWKACSS